MHGYWDEDTTKDRCILRCDAGYEPSGCHVIRHMYGKWKWNHDIPSCHKGKDMSLYVQTQRSTIPPTQQNPNKRPPPKDFFCRL